MEAFGRYQLLKKLATGGMAQIYLARQQGMEGFEKLLVIKRILPNLAEHEDFIKMFLDEARTAARLNHPNVVQIFDLGAIGPHYFIAMEYLHGEDARRVWKQADRAHKPLPAHMACRIAMDAAAGLDYAHKKTSESGAPLGIVHRDVSPQNIIVTFEGAVKLVDFGIAKAADHSSITRSGVVKGKYSYMSPEQAAGKKVDHKTDQFALGIVLYELLTGERLFKRAREVDTLKAVERCEVAAPSSVTSRVPSSLDPVVLKALSRRAEDRYADCHAFQLALDEWLSRSPMQASSTQLTAFMEEIYRERMAAERSAAQPIWEQVEVPADDSNGAAVDDLAKTSASRPERSSSSDSAGKAPLPRPTAQLSTPRPAIATDRRGTEQRSTAGKPASPRSSSDDDGGTTISELSRDTRVSPGGPGAPRHPMALVTLGAAVVVGAAAILAAQWVRGAHLSPTMRDAGGVEAAPVVMVPAAGPAGSTAGLGGMKTLSDELALTRGGSAYLVLESAQPVTATVDHLPIAMGAKQALSPGHHTVVATNRELDLNDSINLALRAGEITTRRLAYPVGAIKVIAPSRATVTIGGINRGLTPLGKVELVAGAHSLVLDEVGTGRHVKQAVTVVAGQTTLVQVQWGPTR